MSNKLVLSREQTHLYRATLDNNNGRIVYGNTGAIMWPSHAHANVQVAVDGNFPLVTDVVRVIALLCNQIHRNRHDLTAKILRAKLMPVLPTTIANSMLIAPPSDLGMRSSSILIPQLQHSGLMDLIASRGRSDGITTTALDKVISMGRCAQYNYMLLVDGTWLTSHIQQQLTVPLPSRVVCNTCGTIKQVKQRCPVCQSYNSRGSSKNEEENA